MPCTINEKYGEIAITIKGADVAAKITNILQYNEYVFDFRQ